jgi:hypothetical protein
MTMINPDRIDDDVQPVVAEFEGEIREFIRKDVAPWRRRHEGASEMAVDHANSLIQRVSGASVYEIDSVIEELQTVREMLRTEGERVQREIMGYANLSQAAMTSMRIIGESMNNWKNSLDHADRDRT